MKILIILISLNLHIFAKTEKSPFVEKSDKNLTAQIIDHPNIGCPTNAECSKKAGKLLIEFKKYLKNQDWQKIEKMRKTKGIPIDIWSKINLDKNSDDLLVSWDSPCSNHQNAKKLPINLSLTFAKSIPNLKMRKHIIFKETLLINNNKEQVFTAPREGSPLYLSNQGQHYIKDMDGNYYDLLVTNKGNFKVSASVSPENYPKTVNCTDELVNKANKKIIKKDLYKGLFCQQIWHKDKKEYQMIIQGLSCL